jgi:hypothetical protein
VAITQAAPTPMLACAADAVTEASKSAPAWVAAAATESSRLHIKAMSGGLAVARGSLIVPGRRSLQAVRLPTVSSTARFSDCTARPRRGGGGP